MTLCLFERFLIGLSIIKIRQNAKQKNYLLRFQTRQNALRI